MLGIEQGLLERISLLFGLFALRFAGGQQALDDLGKSSLGLTSLGIPTNTDPSLEFCGMFPRIGWIRSPDIKLDISPLDPWARCLRQLRAVGVADEAAGQIIVFRPDERVMGDVFTDDGAGVQRGKVCHSDGRGVIESWIGCEHNGSFVGVFLAAVFCFGSACAFHRRPRRGRKHLDALAALVTFFEDQGLDFDALAPSEDVADGNGAGIRHRHGVVEDIEFLVELDDQITILNTVGGDLGPISGRAALEAKDVLG